MSRCSSSLGTGDAVGMMKTEDDSNFVKLSNNGNGTSTQVTKSSSELLSKAESRSLGELHGEDRHRDMLRYHWKRTTSLDCNGSDKFAALQQKRQRLTMRIDEDAIGSRDAQASNVPNNDAMRSTNNATVDALRDSPHPRHVCVVFPFIPPPCLSNNAHCNKCWCYSCEEPAPCTLWGTGLNNSDHCNATASSWYWAKHKVTGSLQRETDNEGSFLSISARPGSMSGYSQSLYGPSSFCSITTSLENLSDNKLLHEESPDTECYPSCSPTSSIVLVANRPRTDPSADSQCHGQLVVVVWEAPFDFKPMYCSKATIHFNCLSKEMPHDYLNRSDQWFEFGTVHIPVTVRQTGKTLEDLIESFDKFSLDIFSHILGESKTSQVDHVELVGEGSLLLRHQSLLAELMANEAQCQLQVILNISQDSIDANLGTAHIRVFLKKSRGDELFFLKELLKELHPDEVDLQNYLLQVDEMRKWAENCDDWTSVAGLLRDLESNGYGEANQPAGLSVPLRPYQRQSLQFMLDAEHRDGGLLSVNYSRLPTTTHGQSLMYSSTLGHLVEAKEGGTVRGGFLCEEMGLGKTIEILALILANPCPLEKCPQGSSKGTLGKPSNLQCL